MELPKWPENLPEWTDDQIVEALASPNDFSWNAYSSGRPRVFVNKNTTGGQNRTAFRAILSFYRESRADAEEIVEILEDLVTEEILREAEKRATHGPNRDGLAARLWNSKLPRSVPRPQLKPRP